MNVYVWAAKPPGLPVEARTQTSRSHAAYDRKLCLDCDWKLGPVTVVKIKVTGLKGNGKKRGPKVGDTKVGECPCCGHRTDLSFGPDPYDHDVHGDDTPGWLCHDCHDNHAADI